MYNFKFKIKNICFEKNAKKNMKKLRTIMENNAK